MAASAVVKLTADRARRGADGGGVKAAAEADGAKRGVDGGGIGSGGGKEAVEVVSQMAASEQE